MAPEDRAELGRRPDGAAVDADDHVGGLELARRRGVPGHVLDEHTGRAGGDLVAERPQGHGRRDLLRA